MSRLLLAAAVVAFLAACPAKDKPVPPPRPRPPAVARLAELPARIGVPFGLSSSDGEGLTFVRLEVAGLVQRPLAYTELHMTFENPADRVKEGRFQITLPAGASVARFAMRQGDRWQEGEMVERRTAQRAYDDFLHRRQDPALLEHEAGNEFSARVFPIPAHGRKELILAYSQEMTAAEPYQVPLRGLPGLGEYRARILVKDGSATRTVEAAQSSWVPDADLVVPADPVGAAVLRHGGKVVAQLTVPGDGTAEPILGLALLVDTSASRAAGGEREIEVVQHLLAALPGATPVMVAAFDQDEAPLYRGPASGFPLAPLVARRLLGATDLERALTQLAGQLAGQSIPQVVVVTDGVITAGAEDAALAPAVAALGRAGVQRLDAIAVGGLRDDAALRRLTRSGLPRPGLTLSADLPAEELLRRLSTPARPPLKVELVGGMWVQPAILEGVQAGDPILLHGEAPEGQPVELRIDGVTALKDPGVPGEGPLVDRSCAAARIAVLEDRRASLATDGDPQRLALDQEMVDLSRTQRVSSPLTAFLVLETDDDYRRYGIDRTSAGAIWAIGPSGLVTVARSSSAPEVPVPSPPMPTPTIIPTDKAETKEDLPTVPGPGAPPADGDGPALSGEPGTGGARAATAEPPPPPPAESATPTPLAEPRAFTGERINTLLKKRVNSIQVIRGTSEHTGSGFVEGSSPASPPAPADVEVAPAGSPLALTVVGLEGPLSRAALGAELAPLVDPLLTCFHGVAWDQVPEGLPPTFELRLGISPQGKVDRVGLVPEEPAALKECLTGKLQGFALRHVPGEELSATVRIAYPGGAWVDYRVRDAARPSTRPWTGRFDEVMHQIQTGDAKGALAKAWGWHEEAPGDVLALVALGEACETTGDPAQAARAYGSIIDLFPSRADLRRFAGNRLERLGPAGRADALAAETYRKAVEQRPDHPSSHHLEGVALLRAGRPAEAFDAFAAGLRRSYPEGRFRGATRILAEDLGLAAAAWKRQEPKRAAEIDQKLAQAHGSIEDGPSVRFVLTWETDGNDVDFHIHDRTGGHAFYASMHLPSGGDLYADVTTGYGPECFTVRGPASQRAYPYWLDAHYYSRGPMGYGMGQIEVIEHDGKGGLQFESRPFVVMQDQAFVDEGKLAGPLATSK